MVMATSSPLPYIQQIVFHLKKQDFDEMLTEVGSKFTAIEIKLCITSDGRTKHMAKLVDESSEANASSERQACPVPPGCTDEEPDN